MVYNPGIYFAKAAILTLYLRIFATGMRMRVLIYSALVVLFLVYFAMIPVATVYCTPRTGESWDLMLLERCHTTATTAIVQGVLGVVSDMYIFVLPLPVIFNLQLPFRKKIGLALVFMAGILLAPPFGRALSFTDILQCNRGFGLRLVLQGSGI